MNTYEYLNECEKRLGNNLRQLREEKGYSQNHLASLCDMSNTTISAYEHSVKTPNLITVAKMAKGLEVSIDRLFYGDENSQFITSAENKGRKIVNCIYVLWDLGIIFFVGNALEVGKNSGATMSFSPLANSIRRLLHSLNDYRNLKSTYPDPDKYLEMLLSSVANEINDIIEREELEKKDEDARLKRTANKKKGASSSN